MQKNIIVAYTAYTCTPFISSKRWIDDFSHKIFLSRLCYSLINALGDDHRSSKRNLELVLELFVIPFCSLTRTKERGFFFVNARRHGNYFSIEFPISQSELARVIEPKRFEMKTLFPRKIYSYILYSSFRKDRDRSFIKRKKNLPNNFIQINFSSKFILNLSKLRNVYPR